MDPNTQQQPPVQTTPPIQAPIPTASPVAPGAQTTLAQAPKSNKKLLLVLLLVLVLVALVGGVAYFYVMGNKSGNNNQAYVAPQKPTVTLSPSPTPEVSVGNSTQLDNAINEVNGATTTTMETEYNQAVTQAKNL